MQKATPLGVGPFNLAVISGIRKARISTIYEKNGLFS
jgi:hypothetical protein